MIRILIQDLIQEALEGAVIDDRQHAKRAIVQFVGRDVTGEISQGPFQVAGVHLAGRLFSPRPPPSFGWWRRERKRGDRATGASWRLDRVSRPPPRVGRPGCPGPGWLAKGFTALSRSRHGPVAFFDAKDSNFQVFPAFFAGVHLAGVGRELDLPRCLLEGLLAGGVLGLKARHLFAVSL